MRCFSPLPVHVCGPFCVQSLRSRPPRRRADFLLGLRHRGGTALGISRRASSGTVHAVSRWASPRSSARSSSAI